MLSYIFGGGRRGSQASSQPRGQNAYTGERGLRVYTVRKGGAGSQAHSYDGGPRSQGRASTISLSFSLSLSLSLWYAIAAVYVCISPEWRFLVRHWQQPAEAGQTFPPLPSAFYPLCHAVELRRRRRRTMGLELLLRGIKALAARSGVTAADSRSKAKRKF